ncbi:unnamed protein product [Malus baccata var. baccata]
MKALGFPSLNTHSISCSSSQKRKPPNHHQRSAARMQGDSEDYELKQMRDMAAVREGKIKALTPKEAGYAIQLSNKTLLDVRPSTEHKKAWVKGSIWIPLIDVGNKFDAGTLTRKFMSSQWDLAREGPLPFKFAGIGGLLEFLSTFISQSPIHNLTDQQRAVAAKEGWSYRLVSRVILLADTLFLGGQQIGHYLQDIRSL